MTRWIARLGFAPLAFAISMCGAGAALAQSATEWATLGLEQYRAGEFAESADSFGRAIEEGAEGSNTFYNAACSTALAGREDRAVELLELALEHGWFDVGHLVGDPDLVTLHEDPRWGELVARCERAEAEFAASIGEPDLRIELLEMRRIDQAMRRGEDIPELSKEEWADMAGGNTGRMKEIVETYGWPTASLVGRDGTGAAWLLVQHADADPEFQRACLELMRAVPAGEVFPQDIAYLTDRVLVNEGKKQIYGTQFWTVDGELVPRPIEDEEGLDARRAEAGMVSMQEYTALLTGRP